MSVRHQADPPGVTWDVEIDGHRYIVIEDAVGTADDCGHPGSRVAAYSNGCRCGTCRESWRVYRARRRRRSA